MWVYRVGAERAKRLLLTGDVIDGKEAARIGLVSASYPADQLDAEVRALDTTHAHTHAHTRTHTHTHTHAHTRTHTRTHSGANALK